MSEITGIRPHGRYLSLSLSTFLLLNFKPLRLSGHDQLNVVAQNASIATSRTLNGNCDQIGAIRYQFGEDELAKVFKRRWAKIRNVIKKLMIEKFADRFDLSTHTPEVLNHPRIALRFTYDRDLGVICVTVNTSAARRIDLSM